MQAQEQVRVVRSWHPFLEGAAARKARTTVEQIALALADDADRMRDPSLSAGASGRAVFFAYLAREWPTMGYDDLAQRYLKRAVDELTARVRLPPSLYGGVTGVAWVVGHLRTLSPKSEPADPGGWIDELLRVVLRRSPWSGTCDLVSGLAGLGLYALERLPRKAASDCLACVVDRLAEDSVVIGGGIAWRSRPEHLSRTQRDRHPEGRYDLGVAHGVPSVIAILAAAVAADVRRDKAQRLYEGAVTWLLAQRKPAPTEVAFGHFAQETLTTAPPRSAWCYGDPGVATTLLAAARMAGDHALEEQVLEIARRSTTRSIERCGVRDASLCHGAAGLGHLYNRLWFATREEIFAEAARGWFDRVLKMREPGLGIAGYRSWQRGGDSGVARFTDDPSLLNGAAGIGLALLAATSSVEPGWDRLLLASLPTVP